MGHIVESLVPPGNPATPGGVVYTSMTDAVAAAYDLVGNGNPAGEPSTYELQCYAGTIDEAPVWTGWVTDQDHYITVRAADGEGHGGAKGQGLVISRTGNFQNAITISQAFTRFTGISAHSTGNGGSGFYFNTAACEGAVVSECIASAGAGGTNLNGAGYRFNSVAPSKISLLSCVSVDCRSGVYIGSNSVNLVILNHTIANCTAFGVRVASDAISGPTEITNLAAIDCVSGCYGGDGPLVATGSNNAGEDGTVPGTNPITNLSQSDFENYPTDLHASSTGLLKYGAGADLSGIVETDVTGAVRSVPPGYTIGAWSQLGGVAPTPPTDVDAGPGYSGTVGTPIAIDGASYTPGTGSPDVILWTFIGPGGSFDDDSILSPTFTPDGVDTYTLTLTITNDAGSDADTASLTATAAALKEMYVKDGGVFKQATPYIKEGGVFVAADAYVRSGGAWVKVQDK